MKFNLDDSVFYEGKVMKVWDYSPRSKSYTLKGYINKDETEIVSEEIVEVETLTKYDEFASDLVRKIELSEHDVRIGGYGFLRDSGKKLYEAYEYDLLTSQIFINILIEIIENKKRKN
ncbi:hypothetical protein LIT32_12385 [Bacillus sp. CMF21]|nr:hypothetical protein LIT32_12385 [Bacillus sp. CMF21]